MLTTGAQRPTGLNAFTADVYEVLESFVMSPWSVLKGACGWTINPCDLDDAALRSLLPRLRKDVARVTDDANADALVAALAALVAPAPLPSSSPVCFDY